jgi:hypothetical protein
MSRNQVRGPSSALSSYLRERGINAPVNVFERRGGPGQQLLDREDLAGEGLGEAQEAAGPDLNASSSDPHSDPASGSLDAVPAVEAVPAPPKRKAAPKAKRKQKQPDNDLLLDPSNAGPSSKRQKSKKTVPVAPQDLTRVHICDRCRRRFLKESDSDTCAACQTISASSRPGRVNKAAAKRREAAAFVVSVPKHYMYHNLTP